MFLILFTGTLGKEAINNGFRLFDEVAGILKKTLEQATELDCKYFDNIDYRCFYYLN